jgi:hypothetical protein
MSETGFCVFDLDFGLDSDWSVGFFDLDCDLLHVQHFDFGLGLRVPLELDFLVDLDLELDCKAS